MHLNFRSAAFVSLLGLLAAAVPLHAQQQSPFNPSQASLDATNELFALPWAGLVASKLDPIQQQLTSQNKNFVDESGNGWEFSLGLDNLKLQTNAATSPPGFLPATGGKIVPEPVKGITSSTALIIVRAPLTGSWSFSITGDLKAHAWAGTDNKVGGTTIKTTLLEQDVTVPFALGVNDVSLSAISSLDVSDPAHPKLVTGNVLAHVSIGGSTLFPPDSLGIDLTRQANGTLEGQVALTRGLGITGFVVVDEGATLYVRLLPSSTDQTWVISVAIVGSLTVQFPSPINEIKVLDSAPFFTMPFSIPKPAFIGDTVSFYVATAQGQIPIPWPPASPPPPPDAAQGPPSTAINIATPLDTIEAGIVATHMPYHAVLSIDYPQPRTMEPSAVGFTYGIDADSTIWTGHYLAAESFRYAATHDANALANVQSAIAGLQTDFSQSTDAVCENGHYTAVPSAPKVPNAPNVPQNGQDIAGFVFARSTILHLPGAAEATLPGCKPVLAPSPVPAPLPVPAPTPLPSPGPLPLPTNKYPDWTGVASVGTRLKNGVCLYVKPQAGWTIGGKETYATYADALKAQKAQSILGVLLPTVEPRALYTPDKPIAYGSACGNRGDADNVVSRDQYSGVFMGLAYAYALVPEVQPQARALIDGGLDYVLLNNWNLPLPPDRTIVTTFMGNFDVQLDLLRIGASVDPTHVPAGTSQSYQQLYARYSPASALCWLPDWFSTADPLSGYYKYNLAHAYFGPLLFLETDPTLQANYLVAYNIIRAPTSNHRNAYFNLVDMLVKAATVSSPSPSNPNISFGDETKSDLQDWVTRWNLVKFPNGMPTSATSQAAAAYLTALWSPIPSLSHMQIYTDLSGNKNWTTTYPVPLQDRTGNGMEFVWQMPPSTGGIDSPGSTRQATTPPAIGKGPGPTYICSTTPPTAGQIATCSTESFEEEPGVDFLLPYWLGVYLNLWPSQ